jgi:tripartite-type tricarboxylate transporter receptor subunit TctC
MQHLASVGRRCVLALVLMATAGSVGAQTQQPYPNKPIRILVGVPPGGSTDTVARLFAEWLRERIGQPVIVENRPGANTAVAADAVARSAADGYTLLLATDAFVTVPLLTKVSFDPFKDFVPISTLTVNSFVMAVHPSVPVNSLKEFITYAKKHPGKLSYASSGNGGASHLGIEKFKQLTGTDIVHIPYRGAGPAMTDAVSGQVEMSLWTPLAISANVTSGKLKPLAVTGSRRASTLPEIPTFAESGLPAFDHRAWQALFAPAGTPRSIVDRLTTEVREIFASPKVQEALDKQGVEPFPLAPDDVGSYLKSQTTELRKLIASAAIKMD